MFKTMGLQVRKGHLDHAGFMAHWKNVHAPLSAGVAGVRGYSLNEIVADCGGGALPSMAIDPPIDGIAELWFDSREAMQALTQTPEAKRWFSDGVNYLGARTGIAATERPVSAIANPRPPFKLIRFLVRQPGVDADAFHQQWSQAYAAQLRELTSSRGYVQSAVAAVNPATNMPNIAIGAVDGVDELWVESVQAGRELNAAIDAATAASMGKLLLNARALVAEETVIIQPPY